MIDAAQTARLVAAEKQRGATVRTAMVHHADPAVAVAEGDELLAEQHQAHGSTIALELRGHEGRDPVAPHQVTHQRAGADARQFNSIACLRHPILPIPCIWPSGWRHPNTGPWAPLLLSKGVVTKEGGTSPIHRWASTERFARLPSNGEGLVLRPTCRTKRLCPLRVACGPRRRSARGTKLRHRGARPKGDAMWTPQAGYVRSPAIFPRAPAERGRRPRKPLSTAECLDRGGRALAGGTVRFH